MGNWIDPEDIARRWHWSRTAPVFEVEVEDPDLPTPLIACGQWVGMTVELVRGGSRVLRCDDEDAYLAFDPQSRAGQLYLVLTDSVREEAAGAFWRPREGVVSLGDLAEQVGGRHRQGRWYADVDVQPVGPILQVEYWAKKYGHGQGCDDGAIFFHDHEAVHPWLAISEDGRLWYAGGDYDATDERGIVG